MTRSEHFDVQMVEQTDYQEDYERREDLYELPPVSCSQPPEEREVLFQ